MRLPNKRKTRNLRDSIITIGVGAAILTTGWQGYQYADVLGFDNDYQIGRTKNSIAAVVTGIAANEAYGATDLDMTVKKTLWPNAPLTGTTTETSIDTEVNVLFSKAHYQATQNEEGSMNGQVKKSEFDWKINQQDDNSYLVGRFGPKFNGILHINVQDGKITGEYERRGLHFDWDIKGTYDAQGNMKITVDDWTTEGITIEGTATPTK